LNEITAIKKGDRSVFVDVYNRFHIKLFRYFLEKSRSRETAKELTQQAFIKLWQSRHTLSELHPIDNQCFTIASSVLIDHLRKEAVERKRRMQLADDIVNQTLSSESGARAFESFDLLHAAAGDLPPVRRNIFLLKMVQGYSNKQIAEHLSISIKTVEDHYTKALRQIKLASDK
jgi:RNA polymerase sigma factor (sigma-70 family)